jgi:serine/threonine-protein kinase
MFERNLAVFERAHGEVSLAVGQTLVNLAVAHLDLGEYGTVDAEANRALEIFREVVGDDHPMVAKARTLRGDARLQQGDPAAALEDFAFALEHERRSLGPEHPSVATALTDMGSAYYELDRFDEAVDHHRRALAILESAWGPDQPELALVLVNLGLAERARGRDDLARPVYTRAVAIAGPQQIAMARTQLAQLLTDAGETKAARAGLVQAMADHAASPGDPVLLATTREALAHVTEDRAEARHLAEAALATFEAYEIDEASARVRAWLDAEN